MTNGKNVSINIEVLPLILLGLCLIRCMKMLAQQQNVISAQMNVILKLLKPNKDKGLRKYKSKD